MGAVDKGGVISILMTRGQGMGAEFDFLSNDLRAQSFLVVYLVRRSDGVRMDCCKVLQVG